MSRSPNPCLGGCGVRTERQSGKCQTCDPPPSVNGLYGGRWVPSGAILRWVPDQEAA